MKLNPRFLAITLLIILAVVSRIVPHIPNFTAMSAVALFGAAQYDKKITAFLVPLTALLVSDALLGGFYQGMEWVYGTFALIVIIGFTLRNKITVPRVIALSLVSSISMYVISDFGVWLGTMYAHTWQGFVACYVAALPFFRNELLGDLFYSGLLFGTFYLAQLKFPTLLKQRVK
jgi:hypothetical protein